MDHNRWEQSIGGAGKQKVEEQVILGSYEAVFLEVCRLAFFNLLL